MQSCESQWMINIYVFNRNHPARYWLFITGSGANKSRKIAEQRIFPLKDASIILSRATRVRKVCRWRNLARVVFWWSISHTWKQVFLDSWPWIANTLTENFLNRVFIFSHFNQVEPSGLETTEILIWKAKLLHSMVYERWPTFTMFEIWTQSSDL